MKTRITSTVRFTAIALLLLCAVTIRARANTITVTNTNDSGPGSLRQALVDASPGDTINFAAGVTTINLTSDELGISKSLTISGPGANVATVQRSVADGAAQFRIFSVGNGSNVTISGLTISNGSPYEGGGGIYNHAATLTVNNCVLRGNFGASYGGGGIMNDASSGDANLTVNSCVFENNLVEFLGGGILNFTTSHTSASLTVTNCTFRNNSAFNGGGIVNYGSEGTVSAMVSNTTMIGNVADEGRGGAIYNDEVFGGSATLTVSGCTISGNSGSYGTGIANSAGHVQISNCTLSGNVASGLGGGIYTEYDGAEVHIINSTLSRNSAGSQGGGIYSYPGKTSSVTARSSIIALNIAPNGPDVSGILMSQNFNLIGNNAGATIASQPADQIGTPGAPIDPLLGPLQNNGGPTETLALLAGSSAIDRGAPDAPPQDQRGYGRVGVPDVGAFEFAGAATHPSFFNGEVALANGVYYLQFPNGTPFGYYSYLTDPRFIYHFDMGYEYWFDANDGHSGIYFYDFMSSHFFYTSPSFPFPYLYDFTLNTVLYYYPNSNNPGHYTTNPRYFYNFATGQIITM